MAEGVGFEPTDGLPRLLISSQVPLTTQPPFQTIRYQTLAAIGKDSNFSIAPPFNPMSSAHPNWPSHRTGSVTVSGSHFRRWKYDSVFPTMPADNVTLPAGLTLAKLKSADALKDPPRPPFSTCFPRFQPLYGVG